MPNKNQLKDLGGLIRGARQEKGWVLKRLSEESGVGYSYLSNIERGYVNPNRGPVTPSDDVLYALSRTLALPLAKIHATLGRFDEREEIGQAQPDPAEVLRMVKKLVNGPDDLLSLIGETVNLNGLYSVPLSPLRASAGDLLTAPNEQAEVETVGDVMPHQARAIRVSGDCMAPYYQDGDILLVRETPMAENGQKVIAFVDGESLSCKIFRANGQKYLEPVNGEGRITADRFRIIGVVVKLIRDA